MNKFIHFIGKKLRLVGYRRCLKNGCEKYHGSSPSEFMLFEFEKKVNEWQPQKNIGRNAPKP